ncbi:MAG: YdeI/OmpD-associated family protein [Flavobacterium sp.]|nr:YdeI/OmpD-associated family protein [Flavobacterium sp.]
MDKTNDKWAEAFDKIKSIFAQTELSETVKWGAPAFTLNGKNVAGIAGFKNHVAIWFFKGMFLKDSKKMLVNPDGNQEKVMRQWRFDSVESVAVHEKLIFEYIQEAIEVERNNLTFKPAKKPMPESLFLNDELAKDATFSKAFNSLTPGKQREYIDHLESAKREQTKLDRMEKIKPMILQGIGLNDKYK